MTEAKVRRAQKRVTMLRVDILLCLVRHRWPFVDLRAIDPVGDPAVDWPQVGIFDPDFVLSTTRTLAVLAPLIVDLSNQTSLTSMPMV